MKTWIAAAIAAVVLAVPGLALAHGGHTHKVLGTVTDVDLPHIDVTTTDKKTVTIMLDASTKITRGQAKVADTDIKLGDRISAETLEKGGMMMVQTLKLGTPAPAKK
jgi:hypothetical protein